MDQRLFLFQGVEPPHCVRHGDPAGFCGRNEGLLIWGGLNEAGELTLEPAFVVDVPLKLPDSDGPYTIT